MLFSQARLASRLVREPRVPLLTKMVLLLGALYLVSPLDLVPDIFPVFGEIDDLTIVLMALAAFLKLCPAGAVAFHRRSGKGARTALCHRLTRSSTPSGGVLSDRHSVGWRRLDWHSRPALF